MKKDETLTHGAPPFSPTLENPMDTRSEQKTTGIQPQDLHGEALLNAVAELSGVDSPLFRSGLQDIVEADGCDPKELTLEAFRESLLKYLDEIHETMTKSLSEEELNALSSSDEEPGQSTH